MRRIRGWAAVLAVLLLIGCTSTAGNPDVELVRAKEPVILTLLMPYDNPVSQKIVTDLLKDYEREHEGTEIEVEWEDYRNYEKHLSALSREGKMPDLALVDNAYVPQLAAKGLIKPLDLWLNRTGLGGALGTEQQDGLIIEESQFGCPFLCWSYGLFFNRHIMERGNMDPPGTWEDLFQYCKKTEPVSNISPFGLAASDTEELTYQFLEILQGRDMDLRRLHYAEECPAITYIGEMVETGVVSSGNLNWDQSDLTRMFSKGGMSCMLNRSTQVPFLRSRNTGFDWFVKEPFLEGDGRHALGIESLVVFVKAQDPAYELLEWLMMPEQVRRYSLEMNSIPVRTDIRSELKGNPEQETYLGMDWGDRMQFSDKYLSWENISQEIRLHVRNLIKQESGAEECFKELQYNVEQYIYLLVH